MEDWLPVWVEELGRAYCLWWNGTKLPEDWSLWRLSIIWWGRINQCLQFVGSAVVVIDIVGPERVRDLGYNILARSWCLADKTFVLLLRIIPRVEKSIRILIYPALPILVILIIYFLAFVFAVFDPPDGMDIGEAFSENVQSLLKILFLLGELFVRILMLLTMSFVVFFQGTLFFVTIISKIMIHPKGEKIFQAFGLIAILVGVHFTLLAS